MAKRLNEEVSLKDLLQNFIVTNKLEKGIDAVMVKDAWGKIMGNGVNSYTQEIVYKNNTLYVYLTSSVLREELSMGKEKIVKLLNEELGKEVIQHVVLR